MYLDSFCLKEGIQYFKGRSRDSSSKTYYSVRTKTILAPVSLYLSEILARVAILTTHPSLLPLEAMSCGWCMQVWSVYILFFPQRSALEEMEKLRGFHKHRLCIPSKPCNMLQQSFLREITFLEF